VIFKRALSRSTSAASQLESQYYLLCNSPALAKDITLTIRHLPIILLRISPVSETSLLEWAKSIMPNNWSGRSLTLASLLNRAAGQLLEWISLLVAASIRCLRR
jgi:hypothetical protein